MIYVVFALIAAAAALYLYLTESRHIHRAAASGGRDRARLEERQQSIKLSLKDMDYERSVGKMDDENFARLQNELLTEWESNEKALSQLPAGIVETQNGGAKQSARCPACNAVLAMAAARFCHACGTRLSAWILTVALFFLTGAANLSAMDIRVTVQNGTADRVETRPLSVQLLKLDQGMQQVAAKTSAGGKAEFLHLPEMAQGPYMVQTVYGGVTYSRAIPPNTPSPAEVKLEIFENTTSTDKIRVRTIIEMRRTDKDSLSGVMILFFVNSDRRAFTGGSNGMEFFLPEKAEIVQAAISVGSKGLSPDSGGSGIEWLKLHPKPGAKKGLYSIGQNVKPGERVLQVMFRLPYDAKGTPLKFQSVYPHQEDRQDRGIQVIAEPESVEVRRGNELMSRMRDKDLDRGLISFAVRETQIEFTLSGGGIAEPKKTEEAAEIEVKSPLLLWQKLVFPTVAILIFVFVALLRGREPSTR